MVSVGLEARAELSGCHPDGRGWNPRKSTITPLGAIFLLLTDLSKSDDSQISVRVVPAGRCPFHVILSVTLLLVLHNKNRTCSPVLGIVSV